MGYGLAAGQQERKKTKAEGLGDKEGRCNYREALLRLLHCFSGFRLRPGGRLLFFCFVSLVLFVNQRLFALDRMILSHSLCT